MLYSGDELKREVKNLIASSSQEVVLISAFIKSSVLEELSEIIRHRKVSIYVRWKLILEVVRYLMQNHQFHWPYRF